MSNPAPEFEALLHPLILEHAYPQFRDGHLRNAVLDAFIAVFNLIRERAALQLDGVELVGRVFSLAEPRLVVSELATESGRSDQKGFMQLLQGAYLGVRNPKAHSLRNDLDPASAAQYLVFASLLARRVEAAALGNFLQFDGVYVSADADGKGEQHVRLYEDGAVLVVSTSNDDDDEEDGRVKGDDAPDVARLMSWFTKENADDKGFPQGTYTQTGNRIEFSAKSRHGEVHYEGEVNGATLRLRVHSLINHHRSERVYTFKPA